jgi:hypothetical protein
MLAAPTDQARAQSHAAAMASVTGMPVRAGAVLALASTFAGNLLIVGSIANIIVVEQAAGRGVVIDWRTDAARGPLPLSFSFAATEGRHSLVALTVMLIGAKQLLT